MSAAGSGVASTSCDRVASESIRTRRRSRCAGERSRGLHARRVCRGVRHRRTGASSSTRCCARMCSSISTKPTGVELIRTYLPHLADWRSCHADHSAGTRPTIRLHARSFHGQSGTDATGRSMRAGARADLVVSASPALRSMVRVQRDGHDRTDASPMRILVVNSFFPPRTTGSAHFSLDVAREYVRQGHDVWVVTTSVPGAPDREVIDGITVVRLPAWSVTPGSLAFNYALPFVVRPGCHPPGEAAVRRGAIPMSCIRTASSSTSRSSPRGSPGGAACRAC